MNRIIQVTCLSLVTLVVLYTRGNTQGCVAIQGMGCTEHFIGDAGVNQAGDWNITTGYRYFKSFRHFRGDVEERHRVRNNTEVINKSHLFDLEISYSFSNQLSLGVNVPFSIFDRSSLYEHYGNSIEANPEQKRFYTSASGLGDIRVSASYWLQDPTISTSNLMLGLGVKIPTGDPHVMGDFHRLDEEGNDFTIRRPVDQSIQLGDGGWAVILDAQAYHSFTQSRFGMYFSGFYMLNPTNPNDVLRTPTANPDNHWSYFSSPDQYGARLGLSYLLNHRFNFGLGGLIEGVPSTDLIGNSEGYRRPGYAVSAEPSIGFNHKNWNFNFSIPVALYRNRVKSVWDKETGRHGDADFADYSINLSVSYRLSKQSE